MTVAFEFMGSGMGPVVVSVPHAGRDVPADALARTALSAQELRQLEDAHVDALLPALIEGGAAAVVARAPRLLIDLNRREDDLDATFGKRGAISARARGGLGLVPTRLGGKAIWRVPPTLAEVAERVSAVHRPYHVAVADALTAARRRHGFALLVDLHSMPPLVGSAATVVLGDLRGRSLTPTATLIAAAALTRAGLSVARNDPYAGGYVLERHGRPERGVHALQIEIDRTLYLDPVTGLPDGRCAALSGQLATAVSALVRALAPATSIAAE